MLCRKVFKVLPKEEWHAIPSNIKYLEEIRRFSIVGARLYSATGIQQYLDNNDSFVLLCFDPKLLSSFEYSSDGISTLTQGKTSINCIEELYTLPIKEPGISRLPKKYDSVFIGQQLDDFIERLSTVPTAVEVEAIIPNMLDFANHPKIEFRDVIACFEEAFSRLPYGESLSKERLKPIDSWIIENWNPQSEDDFEVLGCLLDTTLPKTTRKYFARENVSNSGVLSLIDEIEEEFPNWEEKIKSAK